MSGAYTVAQYMMPGLLLIAGMLTLAVACGIWGVRLSKRYQRVWIAVVPVMVLLCGFLTISPVFLSSMEPVDDIYPDEGYEIRKTAGVLERITPAFRNWVCRTDYWTIDGADYYVLSGSPAEEGMYVLVEYAATKDRVIFRWQESDPDAAAEILRQQAQADLLPKPMAPGLPQWRIALSRWLSEIGLWGAIASVGLKTLLREKITFWLSERDMTRRRGIVRDPVGTAIVTGPMLFMVLILTGQAIGGAGSFGFMLILFAAMSGFFLFRSFPWELKVDGQNITLYRWGTERCYTVQDIAALRYRTAKSFSSKTMEILFNDGEIWEFDVDSHQGVQYTYLYLQERRNKH